MIVTKTPNPANKKALKVSVSTFGDPPSQVVIRAQSTPDQPFNIHVADFMN